MHAGDKQRFNPASITSEDVAKDMKDCIAAIKKNTDGGGLSGIEAVGAAKEQQAAERARKYEQRRKAHERREAADVQLINLVEKSSSVNTVRGC